MGCAHSGVTFSGVISLSISMFPADISTSASSIIVLTSAVLLLGGSESYCWSTSIGALSSAEFAGIKMDSDSGDGIIDGFLRCSRAIPGGIDCRVDPNFDNVSAASFSARGMWWNSHPPKYPLIFCTWNLYKAILAYNASQLPDTCCTTRSESP